MDTAIYCYAGQKMYIVANVYDGLPEEQRDSIKRHLQCPECHAPVHFRRKSRDGKSPCFVATHKSGCRKVSSLHDFTVAASTTKEAGQIIKDTSVEGRLNEVYANAGSSSSLDAGLQALQTYSLDVRRKDDWT